jgi:drug/metabolite transporter superfamily protein YnfA
VEDLSAFVKTEKLQKLQQQKKSIKPIAIAFVVLGAGAALGGLTFFEDELEGNFVAAMGAIYVVLGLLWPSVSGKRIERKLQAEEKLVAQEVEKLNKIKASMSAAEWENYKLQLQNQLLLKTIQANTKKGGKNSSTTSWAMEITED